MRALFAAFKNAAQAEPRTMVRITEAVTARDGSGLCADPHAHTAPETMPNRGGRRVKGRARVRYGFKAGCSLEVRSSRFE